MKDKAKSCDICGHPVYDGNTRHIHCRERKCERCGQPRTDDIDSNICGSCADDLRAERDAEAEEYHQRQLREAYGDVEL